MTPPWLERVLTERDALRANLYKLEAFLLDTLALSKLDPIDVTLLKIQQLAMSQYATILDMRVQRGEAQS